VVAEERQRWADIQALLGGAKAAAPPVTGEASPPLAEAARPAVPAGGLPELTVGSLRKG
jgi:hypothetical protein